MLIPLEIPLDFLFDFHIEFHVDLHTSFQAEQHSSKAKRQNKKISCMNANSLFNWDTFSSQTSQINKLTQTYLDELRRHS
jgi:hypothetical protein